MWDGKTGIWPCGHYYLAERSSVNRPAGTKLWRNETMGHRMYKEYAVDKLIPAILEKWPLGEWSDPRFKIKIQQDNAGGHAGCHDPFLMRAIKSMEDNHIFIPGENTLYAQPANSPDLNILDLGFFNALQSSYLDMSPKTSQDIMDCVTQAYNEYPANKLNRMWVTLQSIYNCVIETHGCNVYKIPHMNKEKLERENRLPRALLVSRDAYDALVEMNEMGDDNTNNGNNNSGDSSQASFGSEGDRVLAEEMADRDSMAAVERGAQVSDEDSIASSHASNWSMSTAEEVIFRKVEADLEAELKAREDDSDSDEEASTNSDHSLSPEDLAYYLQVEAEMLEAGTL
jgi:hypothetical protein